MRKDDIDISKKSKLTKVELTARMSLMRASGSE